MKILLLNSVYQEGSTGKIVGSLAGELRNQGHEVLVCYGLGKEPTDGTSYKICTGWEHNINSLWVRMSGIPFGGYFRSNKRIEKIIEQYRPDIVHVHCVNASTMNVYQLFQYLGDKDIKTVITLHAEIFYTGGCDHAYECEKWKRECHDCTVYKQKIGSWFFDRSADSFRKMKEAISHFYPENLNITAVSPWLAERAMQSEILKGFRIEYVPNGVDTTIFHCKEIQGLIERKNFKRVVLHVTPSFSFDSEDIKGGRFLPDIAKELQDTLFVVVATNSSVTQEQLPSNILLWGRAKSQEELAQLYSESDVSLLLSKRETFSMVTAESLCCGTPVVGFKAGGPESIALERYCTFVEYSEVSKIIEVLQHIERKQDILSKYSVDNYSKENMTSNYLKIYKRLLETT